MDGTRRLRRRAPVSLDYLGEDTTSPDHAAAVAASTSRCSAGWRAGGLTQDGAAEVSVKPTAVGLHLPEHGEKTAAANIERICVAARAAGTTVTVDMEDHTHVDATLRIVRSCAPISPTLAA